MSAFRGGAVQPSRNLNSSEPSFGQEGCFAFPNASYPKVDRQPGTSKDQVWPFENASRSSWRSTKHADVAADNRAPLAKPEQWESWCTVSYSDMPSAGARLPNTRD